jgi:hypothetical protein
MNTQSTPSIYQAQIRRRSFLKGMLEAGAFSAAASSPLFAQSAKPKGDKVRLACCGIGNQGGSDVNSLYKTGHCEIVALCDTDMGAPHTLGVLKNFPNIPQFQDFRKMLDKMGKDIDAVSIGVPDFSHFPIAMLAMSMGKHVFVEKPMAHTFQEVALMMAAEKKYKVAAQMGNQGHSEANYFQFKAWTEAGIIKNVTKITTFMNSGRRWHGMKVDGLLPKDKEPIPSTLDWDTWLATAQFHEYNKKYTMGDWRSWFDFGNGALGDWGAHIFDTAHEFLHLGLPEEINSVKCDGHSDFIFPQASTLCFKFPKRENMPPVELTWYDGVKNLPPLPDQFGGAVIDPNIPPPSSGTIDTKRMAQGKVIYGEGLTFKGGTHGATLQIIPESKAKDMASKLPQVPKSPSNHYANFLLSCKGEEKCRSSFAVAGPLSQVMVLGVIAQRLNAQLKFDRSTQQITNNKLANDLLAGAPPRKDWEQFYKL